MILDSRSTTCFRVLREKEVSHYGKYRTKLQIVNTYDRMRHAIDIGEPYQALLDMCLNPPSDNCGNFLSPPEWNPGHPKPPNWPPHIHPPKEAAEHDAA